MLFVLTCKIFSLNYCSCKNLGIIDFQNNVKHCQVFFNTECDNICLIGYPKDTLHEARLPSGHDMFRKFVYYHRTPKQAISDSAINVHEQLVPFWLKSRLPIQ